MQYRRFLTILLLTSLLVTTGFRCTLFGGGNAQKEATRPIVLNYWRVFDGEDTMKDTIDAYKSIHQNVTINYQKFTFEEYEQKLLDGFAEDRGPDLFSIHNTWVDKYEGKITPLPPVLTLGFPKVEGTLKKTITYQINKVPSLSLKEMKDTFVSTVYDDVVRGDPGKEHIQGLPLSVDTLALFYNQDMLNNAGIIEPPKTWADFTQMVDTERKPPLTIVHPDSPNDFIQSGAAIGTSRNIQRAGDILAAVMLQNGTKMTEGNAVTFDKRLPTGQQEPGLTALQFYTDFGFPSRTQYTWNEDQPDSVESFAQGRVAFFFGYSYHAELLKTKAPQLNYRITPIPLVDSRFPVTTANYWIETVSKKSKDSDYAWDFLTFATTGGKKVKTSKGEEFAYHVESFLEKTGRPTALRALIPEQLRNERLAAFASQLLFAKNWYHGKNPALAENAFDDMITESLLVKGGDDELTKLGDLLRKSRDKIQASY